MANPELMSGRAKIFYKTSFKLLAAIALGILLLIGWRVSHPAVAVPVRAAARAVVAPASALTSDVDTVQSSKLSEYTTKTIGQAFEAAFQDPTWQSVSTPDGDRVVEFRGTLKYPVFRDAGFYLGPWNGVQQGIDFEQAMGAQKKKCEGEVADRAPAKAVDDLVAACMETAYESVRVPVTFRFSYSSDRKRFELTTIDPVFQKFDPDHRLRPHRDATLAFIYK